MRWYNQARQRMSARVCIFLAAVIATIYGGVMFFAYYSQPHEHHLVTSLDAGWTFHGADGSTIAMETLQHSVSFEPGQTVLFSKVLPDIPDGTVLLFAAKEQNVRAYIEGVLVFSYMESPPGFENLFIPLPSNSAGKELVLDISSPYQTYAISPRIVFLGQMDSLQFYLWSNALLRLLIMFFSVLTGLVFIFLSFWKHIVAVEEVHWQMFAFGVASIVWGVSAYSYDLTLPEIFPAALASDINIFSNMLYLPPFAFFVYLNVTVCRKWARRLAVSFSVFSGVILMLGVTGIARGAALVTITTPVFLCIAIALTAIIFVELVNRNYLARFIFAPMLPIFVTIAIMVFSTLDNFLMLEKIRMLSVFALIAMIWAYQINTFFRKRNREKNEMEVIRIKCDLIMKQEAVISGYYQKTALFKHELRHCLASVHMLAKQGDMESIMALVKSMSAQIETESDTVYCKNVVVNSILAHIASMAQQNSVGFECKVVMPRHTSLPDEDCVSLLLNILENALEANEKVPLGNRWISFSMDTNENLMMLSCTNAKADRLRKSSVGDILTTKEENGAHGFGIKVIKKIVAQYEGGMEITGEEDSFAIKILLLLPEGQPPESA